MIYSDTSLEYFLFTPVERKCLESLEESSRIWTDKSVEELSVAINNYISPKADWLDKLHALKQMETYVAGLANQSSSPFAPSNFEACDWPGSSDVTGTSMTISAKRFAMLEVYLTATRVSFQSINDPSSLQAVSAKAWKVREQFKQDGRHLAKKLLSFIGHSATKSQLLHTLTTSPNITATLNRATTEHHSLRRMLEEYIFKVVTCLLWSSLLNG